MGHRSLSISTLAIRRHIGTLMLTLAVMVVGLFFLFRLQVDLLPAITYPRIGLRVEAPGISPEVAVEEVTKPLEQAMSATEGVVQVFSETREGRIRVDLFFEAGGDIDQALNDATASLNRVRNRLPDIVEEPRLFKFDPSQLPIYEFALESDFLEDVDLRLFAEEEISRELSVVPGVATVDVSGGITEEISVDIDLQRLQALRVSLNDVLDALEERNQDFAGGILRGEPGEPVLRTVGKFKNVGEIRNLQISTAGESQIFLKDVATVIDGIAEQRVFVTLNGNPAVKISIQKQPDANTVRVIQRIQDNLARLKASGIIPEEMDLVVTTDESRFIQNSITSVIIAGLTGTILAAIAVFLFLGSLRQTFIIVVAIPLATLAAIILMKLFGLSLNVFSLGGLALGVGIVVDNSIVMLENIAANVTAYSPNLQPSQDRNYLIQVAEKSSQQVESALIASTTTNLVAVVPFLLIGGLFSLLFRELILTISFAIAASLIFALTLVPMLASRLLTIQWSSKIGKSWLIKGFNRQFQAATLTYGKILETLLSKSILVILVAVFLLGGSSLWMLNQIPQEILPKIDTGQARLFARFPPGTTLEANQKVMKVVDEIILKQPETDYVFTTIGGFLFASSTIENSLRSSSSITLKNGTDVEAFSERLTQELKQLNLVKTRLSVFPGRVRGITLNNSPIFRADIDLILQGKNSQNLEEAGKILLEKLDKNVTSARFRPDADAQKPELKIKPDWIRLGEFNLNTQDLGDTIETAIQGTIPTQFQRGERLIDVRVQLNERSRQKINQLAQIPLFTNNNSPIRLSDVAIIEKGKAPGEIQRINQRQVFLLAGNLAEGANLSDAISEINSVIKNLSLPDGVSLLPSSTVTSNQQVQSALKILGLLAVFLVFVVMAVQYNSLVDPFVIILTVPLALAGGILGLYLTQTPIGAMVLVGTVLLVGIVVNNAIVMVELANQLYQEFKFSRQTAIIKAASQRLRPILMTTITTVLGLFPLALGIGKGSEFLQPLGVVVFSGLSLATLLTLLIIPCFYVLLHPALFPKLKKQKF